MINNYQQKYKNNNYGIINGFINVFNKFTQICLFDNVIKLNKISLNSIRITNITLTDTILFGYGDINNNNENIFAHSPYFSQNYQHNYTEINMFAFKPYKNNFGLFWPTTATTISLIFILNTFNF